MEVGTIFAILFILGIPFIIAMLVIEANKNEKDRMAQYSKDYQLLSEEQKATMTFEEYSRRRMAKYRFNPNKNDTIEVQVPAIIDCPACGKSVSNQAQNCPHCGHPIAALKCPNCGSTNVEPITNTDKAVSTSLVGVYAANTVINHHRCKDCGHKF